MHWSGEARRGVNSRVSARSDRPLTPFARREGKGRASLGSEFVLLLSAGRSEYSLTLRSSRDSNDSSPGRRDPPFRGPACPAATSVMSNRPADDETAP